MNHYSFQSSGKDYLAGNTEDTRSHIKPSDPPESIKHPRVVSKAASKFEETIRTTADIHLQSE